MISYHFKGAKANEMRSRFSIEFLPDSNFNTLLRYYNEFVLSTLKRIDGNYDLEFIRSLSRLMDAPRPKANLDLNIINEVKDKALDSLLYHICLDNGMFNICKLSLKYDYQRKSTFKAFICKANNGHIVKTILKKRWWWTLVDRCDPNECDFIWTQWLRPRITEAIKQKCNSNLNSDLQQSPNPKQTNGDSEPSIKHSCVYNRIDKNYHLANKKNLFLNIKQYYVALEKDPNDYIPMTFLIKNGSDDETFSKFKLETDSMGKGTCWIIKPGENTNRGKGIKLCNSTKELISYMNSSKRKSYIVQKYITKPLLINKRKFDIRVFGLFTSINGCKKGYFFQEGYLRTSCKEFTCKNITNRFIHLTNDAVQKKSESYGKYETSNKLSYLDFEKYILSSFPNK